jgi:hypothetical protein
VVLDCGRVDLVERDACEGLEVREDLADARERRGPDAQGVAIEPAGDELAERLGRRLVEPAERPPALLLEHEPVGVLLQHKRERALAPADVDPARAVALASVP